MNPLPLPSFSSLPYYLQASIFSLNTLFTIPDIIRARWIYTSIFELFRYKWHFTPLGKNYTVDPEETFESASGGSSGLGGYFVKGSGNGHSLELPEENHLLDDVDSFLDLSFNQIEEWHDIYSHMFNRPLTSKNQ